MPLLTYTTQTIQGPLTVQVPQVHTFNTVQQINKVVEHQKVAMNQHCTPLSVSAI
jgi:hypothetical protein